MFFYRKQIREIASLLSIMINQNKLHWSSARPWQHVSFRKLIFSLLSRIAGQSINYLEFQLIADQSCLIFQDSSDAIHCKQRFQKKGRVSKEQLLNWLCLISINVSHCQLKHIVKLRGQKDEKIHMGSRCFQFWKERMRQKYGYCHQWFELLNQQRDIRRVSLQRFIKNVEKVLIGTEHAKCAYKVSLSFEKSKKSEIQFSVFMNTILITTKLNNSQNLKHQRSASEVMSKTKKDSRITICTRYQNDLSDSAIFQKQALKQTSTVTNSTHIKSRLKSANWSSQKSQSMRTVFNGKKQSHKAYILFN